MKLTDIEGIEFELDKELMRSMLLVKHTKYGTCTEVTTTLKQVFYVRETPAEIMSKIREEAIQG